MYPPPTVDLALSPDRARHDKASKDDDDGNENIRELKQDDDGAEDNAQ